MKQAFPELYIYISVLIAVLDLILAVLSLRKNRTTGRSLGFACAGAAVVDLSYLISILSDNYLCMSVMSSIYFINIDFMLLNLVIFTVYFTRKTLTKTGSILLRFAKLYAMFEVVVFAANPFYEIAVHYVRRETVIAKYEYQMMPLYWMHLVFSYALVAVVLIMLIRKMFRLPYEYRAQYRHVITGIAAIVLINAIFLFLPGESVYNLLDYSICGYSLTSFVLYWSCFNYSTHGMLNRLKMSVFENIGQGIVLFDYDDQLILHNRRADDLLGKIEERDCQDRKTFQEYYGLGRGEDENENSSVQCYVKNGDEERPLRCDIRSLKNDRGQHLGQLFVFSDAALETDLLTGFQDWVSFQRFVKERRDAFPAATGVAVCDINGLSVVNSSFGPQTGDQKIRLLAETMRSCFPKRTYFVRGVEATLIALCSHCGEAEMLSCVEKIKENFPGDLQYGVNMIRDEKTEVLRVIQETLEAMRVKKLLDQGSTHSEMLKSLIRALEECDSDTEHHVRRTQLSGAQLGKRIGLTDVQQSRLSLLCLLHDIGKIGIPLEILNKPGKLSDEEWAILQTHTRKGYEIANSNSELKGIADEVLHHHERWDGKGYPDGLKGEEIPILSRVIAVVDAYDAMTNTRSYRAAMPVSAAKAELKRCAGSQFDPFIVTEFLELLKEQEKEEDRPAEEDAPKEQKEVLAEQNAEVEQENKVHSVFFSRYKLDGTMHIVSVDDAFEKLTGYSREEAKNMMQQDLIPEEDRTEYLCQVNTGLAKQPRLYLEHRIRRKDGENIFVSCYGRVYYDSAARAERSEIIITDMRYLYSVQQLVDAAQVRVPIGAAQEDES